MKIDYHAKAIELLENIANSVHERDPKNPNPLCFTTTEINLVRLWLMHFEGECVGDFVEFTKRNM